MNPFTPHFHIEGMIRCKTRSCLSIMRPGRASI